MTRQALQEQKHSQHNMATTKTEIVESKTALYGYVQGKKHSYSYRRSHPKSKKATGLIISSGGKTIELNGPQINQLKRLFKKVG